MEVIMAFKVENKKFQAFTMITLLNIICLSQITYWHAVIAEMLQQLMG